MAGRRKTEQKQQVDYEQVCCVRGCTAALYKRGLCAEHHHDMAKRAGVFARNAPPKPPGPRRKSPLIDGSPGYY